MRLFYYHDPIGNFGDDLNPPFWARLIPKALASTRAGTILGIGTILGHRDLPPGPKVVLGAGLGYGRRPTLDGSWDIRFVRGPLTADLLGIPSTSALTDPAVLVGPLGLWEQGRPVPVRKQRIGFIPHHVSTRYMNWSAVCRHLGIRYIDATWPPAKVVSHIRRCRSVISEAMHGAIIADSCRIPWTPVAIYPQFNAFKWRDWLASMELPLDLKHLQPWSDGTEESLKTRLTLSVRATIRTRTPTDWNRIRPTNLPDVPTSPQARDQMSTALREVMDLEPQLSGAELFMRRVHEVTEAIRRVETESN